MAASPGTLKTIAIGVVSTVLGAIVLAMLGLGGGETTLNINGGQPVSGGQPSASATMCATAYGTCPLPFGGQRGGACVCNFGYGLAQGIAQ